MTAPLQDQVAWVTGAGTGIGRAIALALAGAGCRVALTGRTPATLQDAGAAVSNAGGSAILAPADVSDGAALAHAHEAIRGAWGEVDILVNNAGFNLPRRHWRQLAAEAVHEMAATNLTGPMLATLLVLPAMRTRGGGLLVHIGSFAATGTHVVSGPAYSATKHAVRAMSATLNAEEGIHGIRSVCIHPGEVDTPLLRRRPRQSSEAERAKMLQPEDVAQTVLFCATLPPRACVADLTLVPTDNATYRAEARAIAALN